jgi:hypothetical protein
MGSESRKKTELIQVRATPDEKCRLKTRADAFGTSVGELCREAMFGALPRSKVDQLAVAELAATRADLGRVGGLLKGWLAGAFPHGLAPQPAEVRALLKQIEAAQEKVVGVARALTPK